MSFTTLAFACVLLFVCISALLWLRIRHTRSTDTLKYEFLTIAAHKLRTPLTSIKWELSALFAREGLDPTIVESLRRVDTASNQLLELTNVLMDSAHTRRGLYVYQKESIDLARYTTQSVARLENRIKGKNISVVTEVLPNLSPVLGDRGRIASVVDVFIENAVQYNRDGGSVRIAITNDRHQVRFSVSDTGIGVSPEDVPHLFTPFFRTEAAKRADTEGVGIGLSVAKDIITRHKGHVGVESVGEGRGATFWFTLPV